MIISRENQALVSEQKNQELKMETNNRTSPLLSGSVWACTIRVENFNLESKNISRFSEIRIREDRAEQRLT